MAKNTVAPETVETEPENGDKLAAFVSSFAFVPADSVPKRASDTDRLAEFRTAQAVARREAGMAAAQGLLEGKALTDNGIYDEQIDAVRVSSRAKALVEPVLAESNKRPSVTTTGNNADGWRWHIVAKEITSKNES